MAAEKSREILTEIGTVRVDTMGVGLGAVVTSEATGF